MIKISSWPFRSPCSSLKILRPNRSAPSLISTFSSIQLPMPNPSESVPDRLRLLPDRNGHQTWHSCQCWATNGVWYPGVCSR